MVLNNQDVNLILQARHKYQQHQRKEPEEFRPSVMEDLVTMSKEQKAGLSREIRLWLEVDDTKPFLGSDEAGRPLRAQVILLSMRLEAAG